MYKDVCVRVPVRQVKVMFLQPKEYASRLPARWPPCSLVSGLVGGFWALNLVPEILSLLGELALRTEQIKRYIDLFSFFLSVLG